MAYLRGLFFTLFMIVVTLVMGIIFLPALVRPSWTWAIAKLWARTLLAGLHGICGIGDRISGKDRLIAPAIVAANHQSMWETLRLTLLLPRPVFVLKKELRSIPIFGQWTASLGFIFIDRAAGANALRQMLADAVTAIEKGASHIVIFPEGTRAAPGEDVPFQPGVAALARQLDLPVIPMVHNSGHYWLTPGPRKEPGHIHLSILPLLSAELKRAELQRRLKTTISTEKERLFAMTKSPPSSEAAPRAQRRFLIIPLIVAGLLLGGYSFLWFRGAEMMKRELASFVATQQAMGREITYDDLSIRGFPLSLRAQVDRFSWRAPEAWRWSGDRLHTIAMPWELDRLILAPRGLQTIEYRGVKAQVTPGTLRLGIAAHAFSAEARDLSAALPEGTLKVEQVSTNAQTTEDHRTVLVVTAAGLRFTDPTGASAILNGLNIAAEITPSGGVMLDLGEMAIAGTADKGGVTYLRLEGEVTSLDPATASGRLTLTYRDPRALIDTLRRFDLAPDETLNQAEVALNTFRAGQTQASVPLRLEEGVVFLDILDGLPLLRLPPNR
ncbi:1-Acyl-sn-glycerol-3-phosphate acyltransferase [Parvularcula bermudensis HTCC2503]|uniref:1-Acyl-sn-glycerol-3-phosphate acyltransferase n=1 Tax=Parvularcula bermudensis (strain ATCC BAA-594 / HTCC2503 / KCTC 12087) TaxID=314260 RepID=E0TCP7_PARBH|nr:DUF2125 domain-containing protein [Parvularcula bermudensis]ADM08636.1 1-Acyl-sn-glycerol-3-phosphate acyltransferase [Parvularcula bermudensis HTCC2503]